MFDNNKAIYLQIADALCERILNGVYTDRIPGIREIAAEMEVNPNTVQRAFDHVAQLGAIEMQRGVGFFITTDAVKLIRADRKENFLSNELPAIFKSMQLLGIEMDEVAKKFDKFNKTNKG